MFFDERTDGEYRIYAGALEGPRGDGYIAAVVVSRSLDGAASRHMRVVYRDDSIACGHRWISAQSALNQALARGRQVVARERQRLTATASAESSPTM